MSDRTSSEPARRSASSEPASPDGNSTGYFGAKSGAGVWQTIISQMPPHEIFYELFAGSATITRLKRPARSTIVIESEPAAAQALKRSLQYPIVVHCSDALSWLEAYIHNNSGFPWEPDRVFYLDPPYLFESRSGGQRDRYRHEFGKPEQHRELLALLLKVRAKVLISHPRHAIYDEILNRWRRVDYRCMSRGGPRVDSLYCNFPSPTELHDYRFTGQNFRERERLKRKRQRWTRKLEALPPIERALILEALQEISHRQT